MPHETPPPADVIDTTSAPAGAARFLPRSVAAPAPPSKDEKLRALRDQLARARRRRARASSDMQFEAANSDVSELVRLISAIAARPVGRVPGTEA